MREGTKIFKKKRCQEMLNRGEILKEEINFLNDLIKEHPNYETKVGKGILKLFIKKTEWGNNGFWIKRVDGTETDISYNQCLSPRTHLQKVKTACRSSISRDIMKLKKITGVAHHEDIQFIEIFNQWIKDKDIDKLLLAEHKDNCVKIEFKDNEVSEDFRIFHNGIAKIVIISEEEHNKIHFGEKNG